MPRNHSPLQKSTFIFTIKGLCYYYRNVWVFFSFKFIKVSEILLDNISFLILWMVSMLDLSAVDCEGWVLIGSNQRLYNWFLMLLCKRYSIKEQKQRLLPLKQDNVSELSDISTSRLLALRQDNVSELSDISTGRMLALKQDNVPKYTALRRKKKRLVGSESE